MITSFTNPRPGMCQTKRDARASIISLFYAFAVDIVTDLMSAYPGSQKLTRILVLTIEIVMIFPLPTLWKLKMSPLRKYSIMAIFGVGTFCIITSIIRVVQIRSKSGSKQPSPSWLELWAMVEAAIGELYHQGCSWYATNVDLIFSCCCSVPSNLWAPSPINKAQQSWLLKFVFPIQVWSPQQDGKRRDCAQKSLISTWASCTHY